MISSELARALRDAGLNWKPASGDRFRIDKADFEGDVFTVSDMTVEPQHYPTGTILGFNGTTEWALDSVSLEEALWLPREDQLRDLLRGTFRSLVRVIETDDDSIFQVEIVFRDEPLTFVGAEPAEAYARALLELVTAASDAA
jgi:hypothetical protein